MWMICLFALFIHHRILGLYWLGAFYLSSRHGRRVIGFWPLLKQKPAGFPRLTVNSFIALCGALPSSTGESFYFYPSAPLPYYKHLSAYSLVARGSASFLPGSYVTDSQGVAQTFREFISCFPFMAQSLRSFLLKAFFPREYSISPRLLGLFAGGIYSRSLKALGRCLSAIAF